MSLRGGPYTDDSGLPGSRARARLLGVLLRLRQCPSSVLGGGGAWIRGWTSWMSVGNGFRRTQPCAASPWRAHGRHPRPLGPLCPSRKVRVLCGAVPAWPPLTAQCAVSMSSCVSPVGRHPPSSFWSWGLRLMSLQKWHSELSVEFTSFPYWKES